MKFAKDTRSNISLAPAEVLIESFPWIKSITGKTVVIKYGGAAMVDEKLRDAVMSDIVMLKIMGVNPVIVHGGGAAITRNMERWGLDVEFKKGQRVTTDEAMDVVKMTLIGKVNEELVLSMNEHGNLAVGVNGTDAGTIVADTADPDLGRVGKVVDVNPGYINSLISSAYVPIIASVGKGVDGGSYNINADAAAGDGYYADFTDKDSLVSKMTLKETKDLIAQGKISKGMIPKLQSCITALEHGVLNAHIINGTTPHSLLLELLTSPGVGTILYDTADNEKEDMHPLGLLASRLSENL